MGHMNALRQLPAFGVLLSKTPRTYAVALCSWRSTAAGAEGCDRKRDRDF